LDDDRKEGIEGGRVLKEEGIIDLFLNELIKMTFLPLRQSRDIRKKSADLPNILRLPTFSDDHDRKNLNHVGTV
jgi:hypothetical protein